MRRGRLLEMQNKCRHRQQPAAFFGAGVLSKALLAGFEDLAWRVIRSGSAIKAFSHLSKGLRLKLGSLNNK